jgi:vacuolar-type H+-ATPase subunit F/Vma7
MGYVLQMIPLWREMFKKKHALETLDVLNPTQHEVVKLEQQISKLQEDKDAQLVAMKNDIMRMMDERMRQIREGLG